MIEDNAVEVRLQKPFAQSMLIAMSWADQGLTANDIAMLLAVTVRSLEANRGMTGLAPLLASMLPKD
jgi:hypothetical protein